MDGIPSTKAALVVVDIQNDFCPGGSLSVPRGDTVVGPANALIATFSPVILTQDWHPPDHSSFASQHPGRNPFDQIELTYGAQVLWPDHCVQGTRGAEFHPDLMKNKADLIIRKGMNPLIDSYSGFYENDRSSKTGLSGYLRERDIRHVALCGLALDFCVFYTAMDARREGFDVVVYADACRALDVSGSLATALAEMRAAGVVIMAGNAANPR